ncbi:hypothetical protein L810_2688 [Burkholderia sp. AU4i]|nr:hypothetical protein L810_2688 [Burkholderia sp. AU4i]
MEVFPQRPAAQRQVGPQCAPDARRAARPPQCDAGADHHEGPARGELHQQFARLAEQQLAMQHPVDLHEAVLDAQRAEHATVVRVHVHALAAAVAQPEYVLGAAVRRGRDLDGNRRRAGRHCGACTREQRVGIEARRGARLDDEPVRIQQRLDLRLEAIQRARDREDHQERHDEQAGIEVPAPERPVTRVGGMGGREGPLDGGRHGVSSSCSLSGHAGACRRTSTCVAPACAQRRSGRRGAMRGRCA